MLIFKTEWGIWPLNSFMFLSLSLFVPCALFLSLPSDQTVFTQYRPSQGVLKRVCTCAPPSPSMSGHVIIRMSYHFLGYHSSLCFSPSLPSSQSIVSLPPRRCSPLPPVRPWRTCVWVGTGLSCVHLCTPCENLTDRLRSRSLWFTAFWMFLSNKLTHEVKALEDVLR